MQMRDYTEKAFSDLMYEKLESLGYEQTLQYPTTESTFPCIELHTPLKNVLKTQNAFPIRSMFQFSVTVWNSKQRECMEMSNKVEEKLRECNLVRTNTSPAYYDQVIKKYGITLTFEVYYNAIIDSFDFVK